MQGAPSGPDRPFTLARSNVHTLDSRCTRDRHEVHVALPDGVPPEGGWPVLVLLDSEICFATCVETMRRMARRTDATGAREIAVVGLRCPAHADPDKRKRDFAPRGVGKAEDGNTDGFLDLIEHELLPFARTLAELNGARQMLLGHSLAGYFALRAFGLRPSLFERCIALSPSIWQDREGLFRSLEAADLTGRSIFLAAGEREEALAPWQIESPGSDEVLERRRSRRMIGNVTELSTRLKSLGDASLIETHIFEGEDHASIITAAMPKLLRFAS